MKRSCITVCLFAFAAGGLAVSEVSAQHHHYDNFGHHHQFHSDHHSFGHYDWHGDHGHVDSWYGGHVTDSYVDHLNFPAYSDSHGSDICCPERHYGPAHQFDPRDYGHAPHANEHTHQDHSHDHDSDGGHSHESEPHRGDSGYVPQPSLSPNRLRQSIPQTRAREQSQPFAQPQPRQPNSAGRSTQQANAPIQMDEAPPSLP